jgi:hypothetical protein
MKPLARNIVVIAVLTFAVMMSGCLTCCADDPVIGHMERRDTIVTIHAAKDGPRYTVRAKDGSLIVERLTEKELQAKLPDVHRDIKTGVAGNDAILIRLAD